VDLDRFLGRLLPFLDKLPGDQAFAVEVRNKPFLKAPLLDALRQRGVALVLLDHVWMPDPEEFAAIDEYPDGFHVHGGARLRGGEVDARHDHRLAMAFAIAALGASGPTTIHDAGAAAVSYPEFFTVLESLRA
jgi:hypothetical protein